MLKKILLFCLILLSCSMLGAEEYALSREWLSLLYYEKDGIRWYTSVAETKDFFLSDYAKHNPRIEYEASLKLAKASDEHFKKRFPLRYKYLARYHDLPYEPAVTVTDNIQKIILVYPKQYIQSIDALFGNVFLVLETDTGLENSRVLHYVADTRGDSKGPVYTYNGLVGKYNGTFQIEPYSQKIAEYNYLESRDVVYYDLELSAEQIEDLQLHLIELQNTYFAYDFLSVNTAFYAGKILNIISPYNNIVTKGIYTIPAQIVNKLYERNMLENEKVKPAITKTFNKLYADLTEKQQQQLTGLLTKKQDSVNYEPKVLKAFLLISDYVLEQRNYSAATIRHNRELVYEKLNVQSVAEIWPEPDSEDRIHKIHTDSLSLSFSPSNYFGLQYTPINFSSDDQFDSLDLVNLRFFSLGIKPFMNRDPRLSFDLLDIENIVQSDVFTNLSWSGKSQFSFQNYFYTNQEFYLGYAFNYDQNYLYILGGVNAANYDEISERDLENLSLYTGLKAGLQKQLDTRLKINLAWKYMYDTNYFLAELTYKYQDLLSKLNFTTSEHGGMVKIGFEYLL